jgi:putative RecB family exonuclease
MLYRFRVVDQLPEPPSRAATRGTLVHAVLERLFDLPPAERRPEAAVALVPDQWQRLVAAEPELAGLFPGDDGMPLAGWLAGAQQLVEGYFRLEDPSRLEPAGRELGVTTQIALADGRPLQLRGIVDRVDVAPTGEIRIVDYKSGRAPGPSREQPAMFQLRFYALVLWRMRGVVPARLQLIYLGSGEVLSEDPDEADLRAVERKVVALWAAIERATATGDWRPNPGRRCEFCDHRRRCPAWGNACSSGGSGDPSHAAVGEASGCAPGEP